MQTLSQLKQGQLLGVKQLTLSEGLTTFPLEILTLADTLEFLDLSNNRLTSLPKEIAQLKKLKIFFASNNPFEIFPEALGQCKKLEMIGFKSNKIKQIPDNAFPPKLRWLILTDNLIEALPSSLGECTQLQKLMLAGNCITHLPNTIHKLVNLALIRLSANQLTHCPMALLRLPKLAWIAFAGNPFSQSVTQTSSVPLLSSSSYCVKEVLGQGASGVISKAVWNKKQHQFPDEVAVKVFKGKVTSDGYPRDELQACLKVGYHPSLISSLARVNENNYLALIMNLIPQSYSNLGLPPSLQSCTRDTFPEGFSLGVNQISKIVHQMRNVFEHLHKNQVCHGDLYAHNTLIDEDATVIFGDFGAASMYHMLNCEQQDLIKKIENRALNYFIEDLLMLCKEEDKNTLTYEALKQSVT